MNFDNTIDFVQLRTGNHSLITNEKAGELINLCHAQVLEEEEWSRKHTEIIISTQADKSTGTFAAVNGASTMVGTGIALAAGDVGRYIKIGSDLSIYKIGAFSVATITLHDFDGNTVTYSGTTNATASFVAFKRWYSLGEAIEGIDSMVYDKPLREGTTARFDDWDRDRVTTGTNPDFWGYGPRGASGFMQVEFWPRTIGTLSIRANVRRGHTDLKAVEQPIVPFWVIGWKAAAEACLFLNAKTNQPSWVILHDKYDAKYEAAKKRAMEQDQKKAGLPHRIRDSWASGRGDDFGVAHDDGF